MKVRVFKVRIWMFIRRKRMSSISGLMARLFGRKPSTRKGKIRPAVREDHLHSSPRTSLVRQVDMYSDDEFEEQGPSIITKRRTVFSMKSEEPLERKVHSKRHMHVITMWNPASVTTVESPVESSPKIWFRQASKRWKDHGSGRMLLDPIENGPESSQDWRQRYFDIDPDSKRWPVQGW